MNTKTIILNEEESQLLNELEANEWQSKPLSPTESTHYQQSAKYTKSLQQKKQTTIRFALSDLATVKAKSQELGIGYQNLIQMLVHNYAVGKIKLEI
jgi:predicted DNA binding CopG/RHH family protein